MTLPWFYSMILILYPVFGEFRVTYFTNYLFGLFHTTIPYYYICAGQPATSFFFTQPNKTASTVSLDQSYSINATHATQCNFK